MSHRPQLTLVPLAPSPLCKLRSHVLRAHAHIEQARDGLRSARRVDWMYANEMDRLDQLGVEALELASEIRYAMEES